MKIDKGFRGVTKDKFRGTREKIFRAGVHFFPLRAIPPFFKLFLYPEIERPVSEKITINLPYKDALEHAGDFKIMYRVILKYRISDKRVISLSHGDNYSSFKEEIKETVVEGERGFFINKLMQIILTGTTKLTKKTLFSELYEFTTSTLKERYGSDIKIISLNHVLINLPDIEKYRVHYTVAENFARQQSADYVKKMLELNYKKRLNKTMTDIEIKRLERYIALMKKGHNILPFLFMEKLSDKIRLIVLPEGKQGLDLKKYFNFLKSKNKDKNEKEKSDIKQGS